MRRIKLLIVLILLILLTPTVSNAIIADTLDFPIDESLYIPGSYAGRSFFYEQPDPDHLGEDIDLSEGTPIRAIGNGTIVWYSSAGGYGELVAVIEHDLGVEYIFTNGYEQEVVTRKILSIYGHIRKKENRDDLNELNWAINAVVMKGEIIGYINDSSHPDGGTPDHNGHGLEHLHMGIRLSDKATAEDRDPGKWFRGYEGATDFGKDFASALEVINLLKCPDTPQDQSLARIEGEDPVYWLQNRKGYHVLSTEIINDMSGLPGWGNICDYSPDILEIIPLGHLQPEGTFLQGPNFITTGSESNDILIQLPDDPKVYLIENGQRRWITSEAVFNNLGYDWNDIIVVTQAILDLIPEGDPITEAADFYLLSGALTDASGNPLQGWVYAYETSGANLGNQVYSSDGTYEMALFPGNYNVYAYTYTSYPRGSVRIKTQTQNISMTQNSSLNIQAPLYDFYHLTGRVTDINGVGLTNVSVQAYDNSGICQSYTTTDSNGDYDALLIAGTYSLYFRPPSGSRFIQEQIYNLQIYDDTVQDISLSSSQQYALSGALTDDSGNPQQGWVYANRIDGIGYGNVYSSDGTFEMALFPGTYRVYARVYTYYQGGSTHITTPYQTININHDISSFDIVAPLYDFYHLSGQVTDITDVAQPNVSIRAYDSSGICGAYTSTDSNGNYDLLLIPGTYRLRITAPPATYPPFEIKKVIISGDRLRNIRLSLEYALLEEAMAQLPADLDLALDVFDIIDQGTSLRYDIIIQGIKDLLQIILNWQGSEMKATLYEPNGNVYGEYQSTNPPINIEIPNPIDGTWKCEITAVDVPYDNYPFALVVGITPNQLPVADPNGPYSGTVDSPIIFDASDSYDPDGNIASYEWDWNNDGTYDESTISTTISHTWTEPYSGSVALRVRDAEGATHVDTAFVEVIASTLQVPGDLDLDGDVDRDDLNIILAARNTPADGPDDPRDLDGDGMITALDARKLVLMCTRPRCACEELPE